MRKKEKIIMLILSIMFLASGVMFYYQNVYSDKADMKNKQYVVVATKEIAKGATFKEGENYGVIPQDKEFVFKNYVVYGSEFQKEKLEGKKANSPILKNEVVTTDRVDVEGQSKDVFRLFVQPDNYFDAEKGDRIDVYVQVSRVDPNDKDKRLYETYSLMRDVVVESVVMKKNSNGVDTATKDYLEVHVPKENVTDYQLAEYLTDLKSKILAVEYNSVLTEAQKTVRDFNEYEFYDKTKEEFKNANGDYSMENKGMEKTAPAEEIAPTEPTAPIENDTK